MELDSQSTLVEDYAQSLNELTFNSRPIIDNLTTIAQENSNVADGIVNAIINRILRAIPEQKLFALYLLDSICKTVGNPYNILAGDEIFRLFSHVYLLVNDVVRQKLVNLFETWKLTKSKGTNLPLFPKEQMDKIANFLSQAQARTQGSHLTNGELIDDINTLIPIFQNKLINNPDPKINDRFSALIQLKGLLLSQPMKINELQAVQVQLQNIKQQELNVSNIKGIQEAKSMIGQQPGVPPFANTSTKKIEELFGMLVVSGLIQVEQSFKPGSLPSYKLNLPRKKYQPPVNLANNVDNLPSYSVLEQLLVTSNAKFNQSNSSLTRSGYDQLKFNELNNLTIESKGLQNFINSNKLPRSTRLLLYDSKPYKCGTCGKRFTTDDDGVKKRRLHLDWHFRVNKKMSTYNIQSRIWYLDDIDWVKFRDDSLSEFGGDAAQDPQPVETPAESDTTLVPETTYVTIPANDTNRTNKCLICRDQIRATYNDDIGEWCWFNCIRAPGEGENSRKIIHLSCFQEANKKRSATDNINGRIKREKI